MVHFQCFLPLLLPFARAKGRQKHTGKRCTAVYRFRMIGSFDQAVCYCERCYSSLIINDYELAGGFIGTIYQGSIAEATVVPKFNQGSFPKSGRNRFRAAFCVTFFRKKVTKKKIVGL